MADHDVPLEYLKSIQARSKQLGRNLNEVASPESYAPREILGLVYLCSIAVAELRFGIAISQTSPAKLCEKMNEYINHSWISDDCREVLSAYVESESSC